jgi:hypothetical protein
MAPPRSLLQCLCSLLLFLGVASALKFELAAHTGRESQKKERCIRNPVGRDTLVVVTATVGGARGDGMTVNIHVSGLPKCIARAWHWLIPSACPDYRFEMLPAMSTVAREM